MKHKNKQQFNHENNNKQSLLEKLQGMLGNQTRKYMQRRSDATLLYKKEPCVVLSQNIRTKLSLKQKMTIILQNGLHLYTVIT